MIVDKSEIILQGLSALLLDKNNTSLAIEHCRDESKIQQAIHKVSPKILIASPSVFEQNAKQLTPLKEKYEILSIGLVYSFQHPNSLTAYEGLIYLNDDAKKIQLTVDELLEKHSRSISTPQSDALTPREKEILKLLVSGNTTKQIATILHISTHTVNAHRKNIMRKLGVKTVSGLTIYAVINNIITLKEI